MASEAVATQVRVSDGCALWSVAEGDGVPVVFCHGGPGLWDYLAPMAQLIGDGHRIHRWDQRGCGRSDRQRPWTLARFTRDLDAIRTRFGYERWIVGGHSFGADLALRYAARYPHRTAALIYLCGTGLDWNAYQSAYHEEQRRRLTGHERRRLEQLAELDRNPEEEREFLTLSWATDYADRTLGLAAARAMAGGGMTVNYELNQIMSHESRNESSAGLTVACRALQSPALIVQGERDPRPLATCDSVAEALPAARRVVIPAAGHLPWIEAPDQFRRILTGFLSSVIHTGPHDA